MRRRVRYLAVVVAITVVGFAGSIVASPAPSRAGVPLPQPVPQVTSILPADGAVVLQALRAAVGDLDHPHDPPPDLAGDQRPEEYKVAASDLAEALVEVAAAYLRGKVASADNADVYQVQVHVVPEILDREPVPAGTPQTNMDHPCRPGRCHLEDGPAITPADAQRIACSATLSAMLHDPDDGSVLDAGGRSRSPPPRSAGRCANVTVPAAASRAAIPGGPTCTILCGGTTAAPPAWTT